MISNYLIAPSLNSLFLTGLLLLLILVTIIRNFKDITKLPPFYKLILLSILTIAIGVHGLIHLGVEKQYNFNPYKWF